MQALQNVFVFLILSYSNVYIRVQGSKHFLGTPVTPWRSTSNEAG